MAKTQIEYAVLSLCTNLTDPDAGAQPIGLVAVGKLDEDTSMLFIGIAGIGGLDVPSDDITQQLLRALPNILSERVKSDFKARGEEGLLEWLHGSLRNSVHISRIEGETVEADWQAMAERFMQLFWQEMTPKKKSLFKRTKSRPVAAPVMRFSPLTVGAEA